MENTSSNETFPDEEDGFYADDMYSCPPIEKETALEKAAKLTALSVIIVTSFIGNILIISVTRRTRSMRKIAYNFVVNMAIADLCRTVINMPESLAVEIRNTDEWLSGDAGVVLCKLLPFCQDVCAFCSILSLLAIALDRCLAICLPLKRIMTQRISKVIILFTWLIPSLASAPMLVANNVFEEEGLLFCFEAWPAPFDNEQAPTDYTIILFVLFYALPLIIISTLYTCVVYKIWRRRAPGNHSSTTNQVYSRSRRKALKMFIAIVVCFTLCWLPYHVRFFLESYNEEFQNCGVPGFIFFISLFFSHAISALNPCIYMTFNKDYRNGAKRVLSSCCCKNPSALYPEVNTGTAVNSHTGGNEGQALTTFYSRSLRLGITKFWNNKIEPYNPELPKHDNYNQGFLGKDEINSCF